MKARVVWVLTLGVLTLFGLCTPAFAAAPPQHGTFTMGTLEVTTDPGTQFQTDNILHMRDGVAAMATSGLPWGTPLTSTEWVSRSELDVTTGLGSASSKCEDVYANGVVVGSVQTSINGLGFWTYPGPNISLMGRTLTTGQTFFALLMSGTALKHGVSGELKGLKTRETFTSVHILDFSGPIPVSTGVNPGYATGTYTWLH